jgi:spore maturation protein CgeB
MKQKSVVIVGGEGGTNIASAFTKISFNLGVEATLLSSTEAYKASELVKKINWYLNGRYPTKLNYFSEKVVDTCLQLNSKYLLTTGISPVNEHSLKKVKILGVKCINFLTDDPWNPSHYAPWFFKALPHYDIVFSPRRAMVDDLSRLGCCRVEYLPFGYDPDLFYRESTDSLDLDSFTSDIMFAGGADQDRIPYISALIEARFDIDLYGSYWERYSKTKLHTKGQANVSTLRNAIQSAKIALCIVRRANRDGHCMRTFEVPAIGTCMLTEDTAEHREIFGQEGDAVVYFNNLAEMVQKTSWLLGHDEERKRLAENAHLLITNGKNTYQDRLSTIFSTANML